MRKTLLAILLAGSVCAVCFGQVLTTALPIGTEQFAIQGFYSTTPIKAADSSLSAFGPRVIYGIAEDLDLIGKLAMGSIAGVGSTTLGIGAKYTFLKVAAKDPFDMAGYINYDSSSSKDYNMSTLSLGVVLSKYLRNNFTLYGLLCPLQFSAKYTGTPSVSATALQLGIGIKYQVNKKFSMLGEISTFSAEGETYTNFSVAGEYNL